MRENYDDSLKMGNSGNGSGTDFQVKFFALKNGESALVRILVDDISDLNPYTFHDVSVIDPYTHEEKHKKIGCVRSLREDLSKCPLCASGSAVDSISYIHLIQYTKNADGTWKAEPKIWGKKPSASDKSIIGMITNALKVFGPLSNYVSMITRSGEKVNTTYSLNVNIPAGGVYSSPADLPLDRTLFDGFTEDGTVIRNWTADEMTTFITTGEVPRKPQQDDSQPGAWNPATAKPAYQSSIPTDINSSDLPFNDATQHYGALAADASDIPFGRPATYQQQAPAYQQAASTAPARPTRYQ